MALILNYGYKNETDSELLSKSLEIILVKKLKRCAMKPGEMTIPGYKDFAEPAPGTE